MYKTNSLIISTRKELSIKYKKLIEALGQNVQYTDNLSLALSIIQKENIEFIIISDTIKEKLSDFVQKIRVLTYNNHPIIIAISKSDDLEDKLKTLEMGADDYLEDAISKSEFQMRFKAHIRRYLESSINPTTRFLNKNITLKAIDKSLKADDDISYLLIKIKGIELYQKIYGEIAYEKVLQTLGAIISSILAPDDYCGHIDENDFILITQTIKAEKIASFLTFGFDNILNKFYSTNEFNDNFTICSSDGICEIKQGLMKLNIASCEKNKFSSYKDILNSLRSTIKLCNSDVSSYVIDRMKLKGEVSNYCENKEVIVFEPDSSLAYLLKNICELDGIKITTVSNISEFNKIYETCRPKVVLLDWASDDNCLEIAKKISDDGIKLIFSSSYLNKSEILKAGADLYLPKPYEVQEVLDWIKKFIEM